MLRSFYFVNFVTSESEITNLKTNMKKFYYILLAVVATSLFVACGGDDDPGTEPIPEPSTSENVAIKKITFQKVRNKDLDRDLVFKPDANNKITGRIYTYKLINNKTYMQPVDIRGMIATFDTDAWKLYCGDKEIISGSTRLDCSRPFQIKAMAKSGQTTVYNVDLSHFTKLPIIYLNTDSGQEVRRRSVYEGATLEILGVGDMNDTEFQKIQIHGRGNATWTVMQKKPSYTFKLESRQKILGMPKHKKWVLMANYRDKTLMRNSVSWWISRKLPALKYVPKYVQAEMIFNGAHRGVYQLAEQVRIDKNRVAINEMQITDTEGEAITGGYIIELDRIANSDLYEWVMPNMHGSAHRLSIKKPKIDEMNQQQHDYIKAYVHKIDEMFGDPSKLEEVMTKYIDMPSWAAQWLVFEISGTPEPNGPSSWFTYKEKGDDKWYCGPPWDFDYKSFVPSTANQWINAGAIYMPEMLKYPPFKEELIKQWKSIRGCLPELISYINQEREYLRLSASANWAMHEQNLIDDDRRENGDEFIESEKAIDRMIEYLKAKWEFIDQNIAHL